MKADALPSHDKFLILAKECENKVFSCFFFLNNPKIWIIKNLSAEEIWKNTSFAEAQKKNLKVIFTKDPLLDENMKVMLEVCFFGFIIK